MTDIRTLVAGNWKMNGVTSSLSEVSALISAHPAPNCDVLLCPPATLVGAMVAAANGKIAVGGQDCHWTETGAHTGDVSAQMLADAGATAVIVGHSERRADHYESDTIVKAKAEAVLKAGLMAVVCIGETEAERDAGTTLDVVRTQLAGSLPAGATAQNTVIAYEPVLAIGTGRTPSIDDIAEVHDALRVAINQHLPDDGASVRLLYGGSVKPGNAAEIFAIQNVNGGLVGGASLKASDFGGIIDAA